MEGIGRRIDRMGGRVPDMWPMNWRGRKTPNPKQKAMPRNPIP